MEPNATAKEIILAIVTKSPWPEGRYGPLEWQDWIRACIDAALWKKAMPKAQIVVPCATQPVVGPPEVEYYVQAFRGLGYEIEAIREGYETLAQIKIFGRLAKERNADLVLFTTWTHYPRVVWICWRCGVKARKFVVAWGIPRPREALTDLVNTFLYPALDLCGLQKWFKDKVIKRRLKGKL